MYKLAETLNYLYLKVFNVSTLTQTDSKYVRESQQFGMAALHIGVAASGSERQ